jgi:hypothetical protein
VKHFEAIARAVPPATPAVKMRALLLSRKSALEGMIRERHRQAREHHKPANVTMYSAALRALKRQIGILDRRADG